MTVADEKISNRSCPLSPSINMSNSSWK